MEPDPKLGQLFINHWTDWFFIIVLIGLYIVCEMVTPFQRYVGATNFVTQSLKYPYKHNTVPSLAVPVIALVIPLVFISSHFCFRRNVRDLHHAILGLLTTVALTAVITDAIKDGIGQPRPHFYARCFGSPLANATYDATGNVVCILPPSLMKESYKSFPSGHASGSFAGLGYLAMYLAGKLGVFDRQGHSWKLFPVVLPILGATFVGITRVDDYWHHWTDVCAGAAIGLFSAYFCYRQHFPSLFDGSSNVPYPHMPRRRGVAESVLPTQVEERPYEERLNLDRGSSQIPIIPPQARV
ncbi:hypothetical protein KC19_9G098100 [Ceratodon purpureus]|uniref:Phosphatidic acid phosphatase type 2/haloperoxidase domain-containing protein n=1 Tax=Ceratodon purpureus TaxID=3225 RepID=A0A8T0GTH5_CERPU|nr:hypothetical protein KC19_9G098100 [Ceratodon purpureus]